MRKFRPAWDVPLVVDGHQHIWDPALVPYAWMTDDLASLRRAFSLDEIRAEQARVGVRARVLVQSADSVEDTEHMIQAARADPSVVGVVAWLPLTRAEEAMRRLEGWGCTTPIVGVRHLVHREPDPTWLLRPDVAEGLSALAEHGLTFDVCAETSALLAIVPEVAEAHPDLTLVVDHLGKPPIRDGSWEPWAGLLSEAASQPNVVAKVSGLNTAAGGGRWTTDAVRPYVEHAVTVFGAERLMYGGDWPFALSAGHSYGEVWRVTRSALEGLSPFEVRLVFNETARRVYGLELPW